jgi:GTPase SAR1 family protein
MAFRCTDPAGICAKQPDKRLGKYWGTAATPLPRVFVPRRGLLDKLRRRPAVCICHHVTKLKVCPNCHNEWPPGMDAARTLIFGIAGATGAGKSHYLGVLIHELMHRVGVRFQSAFSPADDQTRAWYNANYDRPLYGKNVTIPSTSRGKTCPLIYHLTFHRPPLRFGRHRTFIVVLYDTAGQHFDSVREMERYNLYLAHTSGVILLVDPTNITAVSGPVPPASSQETTTSPLDIITRIDEIIRSERSIAAERKIGIPVAVTLSKLDLLVSRFPPGSPLQRDAAHAGFFDLSDFRKVRHILRDHLEQWLGPALDNFLRHKFTAHSYFGISAIGRSPATDGRLGQPPTPFRIEDPFVWLLYRAGVLRGRTVR